MSTVALDTPHTKTWETTTQAIKTDYKKIIIGLVAAAALALVVVGCSQISALQTLIGSSPLNGWHIMAIGAGAISLLLVGISVIKALRSRALFNEQATSINDLAREHAQLQINGDRLIDHTAGITVGSKELEAKYNRLIEEYKRVDVAHKAMVDERDALVKRCESITNQYSDVAVRYNDLLAKYNALGAQCESLTREHDRLATENRDLTQQIQQYEQDSNNRSAQHRSLMQQFLILDEKLKRRESTLEELNTLYTESDAQNKMLRADIRRLRAALETEGLDLPTGLRFHPRDESVIVEGRGITDSMYGERIESPDTMSDGSGSPSRAATPPRV